jgi:hypothetical protein
MCLTLIITYNYENKTTKGSYIQDFYRSGNESLYLLAYLISYLIGILAGMKVFTSAHLILFHVYLRYHNMTTYKYIMTQRKRKTEVMKLRNDNKSNNWSFNCNQLIDDSFLVDRHVRGIGMILIFCRIGPN